MNPARLEDFARSARRQLHEHILPFWSGPALDQQQGGWMAWLSNDLRPDRTQPKGLIVHARILWAFSAAFRTAPQALYGAMAERAHELLAQRFWDARHGGAFWQLDDDLRVRDDAKKIYGHAFYIYALAEYHQAFGAPVARARAVELFELIERHAHDPSHGGYFEVCRRDWTLAENARLSEKDLAEKKSMNNQLHVLEAYTNLYRIWPEPRLARRLRELMELFAQKIADPDTGHLRHFFDERWQARGDDYTFGHDIESSWLLCEAAEVLGDATLRAQARALALRQAAAVWAEALDADGGLCYAGRGGRICDRRKECWPQAEAVIGFLNAFQLGGDARYLEAAGRVWDYILEHLADRVHGEWFWRINEDGRPDPDLPKVSEWKGPYHGSRACLEIQRRLEDIRRDATRS